MIAIPLTANPKAIAPNPNANYCNQNVTADNASAIDRNSIATATLKHDRPTLLLQPLHIAMDHDAMAM